MLTSVRSNQSIQSGAVWADWRQWTPPTWLANAVKPNLIRGALLRHAPEFASGQLRLRHCEVKRLRLREEKGVWSGIFLLAVDGLRAGLSQVVPVRGTLLPPGMTEPAAGTDGATFGREDWHCYLPELRLDLRAEPPEAELAALPQLTDPEQARALLEASIRVQSPAYRDLRLQACHPEVMRYKPGSRCTIRYQLEYPPSQPGTSNGPPLVVAKTYKGDKGLHAYTSMQALWASPLGQSKTVAIAEPLAYLPELNVLVQGPIFEEATLKEQIRAALRDGSPAALRELERYLDKTARGLAELHQCGVRFGETVTWADELAEIVQRRNHLAKPLPELAELATPLLVRLQALAAQYPSDPAGPAHRSFRPAQVLLHQGEIGFIDFDGFCQAEPAMDMALFLTTVKNLSLNKTQKVLYRPWREALLQEQPGLTTQIEGTNIETAGEFAEGQHEDYASHNAVTDSEEDEPDSILMDPGQRLVRMQMAETLCANFLSEYEKYAPISRERVVLWETLALLDDILGSWVKLKFGRLDNCMFLLERHLAAHPELLR
jgi:hypothetical protein